MRIRMIGGLAMLLWVLPLGAQTLPAPKVQELWEVAYLEGARAGYFRTTIQESESDGQKRIRTTQEMNLTLKRQGTLARLRAETGTEEDAQGKVVGVSMKMVQQGGSLVLKGELNEDGKMHVDIGEGRIRRQLPWNDQVLGLYAQEKMFASPKPKAGDKKTYLSYEPTVNAVVTVRVIVQAEEEVEVLGQKKKLLRATFTPDRLEVPGTSVQLPAMTVWLGSEGQPVMRQFEIPGIGIVTAVRTTRDKANAPIDVARLPDLILKTMIALNRRLPGRHTCPEAVYLVTIDDADAKSALANDDRQQIRNVQDKQFELHIKSRSEPEPGKQGKVSDEFLKSCYYLNSADEKVKALARQAVGAQTDPWTQAKSICRWVQRAMTTDNSIPFATAGQVARQLRGDCRQHAMLAAAMCRASGIPSRTAIGVVYVEDRARKPLLGFHMWLEVFVQGQWLSLDPIFGPEGIGAGHIKVADHSWHEVQDWRPLLPVTRVLGKMRVEVLSPESE